LVFGLFGKGFDFGWGDRNFFTFANAFDDGLGADFVGCLVFGTQPAYVSVTFFFGALGVEGDKAIEDDFGDIKIGGSYVKKMRNFQARIFRYEAIDMLNEITNNTDRYTADFDLAGGYVSI